MKLDWVDVLHYGIFAIVVIVIVELIIYEVYIEIRNKFLRYKDFSKVVKVGRKKHQDAYTTYMPITISTGKNTITTMTPIFHDEEFNVYLVYKGEEYCFDDEDMFDSLKVGDKVNVVVHKGYNRKGELKNIYLTIVE